MEALEKRLQDGFQKIGEAMQQGITVTNWEKHWIELLRQYEALADELAAMKPEQVAMGLGVAPVEREVA
jgi:hypothetical protein